ncbi:hypothetical protein ACLOJK_033064 [Asimina triloba]
MNASYYATRPVGHPRRRCRRLLVCHRLFPDLGLHLGLLVWATTLANDFWSHLCCFGPIYRLKPIVAVDASLVADIDARLLGLAPRLTQCQAHVLALELARHQPNVFLYSSAVGAGSASFLFAFLLYLCSRVSLENPISFWKRKVKDVENVEAFLKTYGSLIPRRYLYSELKNITSSFKEKLGQGGYGSVFKGKLSDGRLVAVKVLDQSKGSGEEFINEVASIGRTYHVNVVALLGFCSQGSKRALVYEFMPNGSLERFIYSGKNHHLGWERLCEIALGIARGLEYLHRGCDTRILHFDIKPHNILLDKDFCPKISDFGLAKLCPSKESIISLLGARGTIGYIAPEVYCRNFGGVSSKSDVYSYGMMVLEMVGGRRNIDAEAENTSEIYFPDWIYMRLDVHGDLGLHDIKAEAEEETARKMITVGLWCIQTDPRDRPSMGRVVEMLEGSLESLPVPPKPFLYSPARPNQGSSTTSLS